jgi:flagella basal body P-ring formation protein FlgA
MKKIAGLVLLVLHLLTGWALANEVSVVLSDQVTVQGPALLLGELASISGDDANRVRTLRELKIGNAALPGSSVVIPKALLRMRLAATGIDLTGITWQIPPVVTVTTGSQAVNSQELVDRAIAAVHQRAGTQPGSSDITITPIITFRDLTVPLGVLSFAVDVPYGIRYQGPTTVSISISADDRLFTKVNLRMDVKRFQKIVVAARPIAAQEILQSDNLQYERRDIGTLASGYYTDISKVVGLMARRSMAPGVPLNEASLAKPVLIRRGSVVTILAHIGNMAVRVTGQALQDGSESQEIRVQNTVSNKIISARVVDETTVQVLTY